MEFPVCALCGHLFQQQQQFTRVVRPLSLSLLLAMWKGLAKFSWKINERVESESCEGDLRDAYIAEEGKGLLWLLLASGESAQ